MGWENRNNRIAALVAERGLKLKGFRRSLKALVMEFSVWEDERGQPYKPTAEDVECEFEELFGACRVVPAAYRIIRGERCESMHNITVEVYHVEGSIEIPDHILGAYSRIADGDGPCCELHLIDRYDHEITVEQEMLETFWVWEMFSHHRGDNSKHEWLKAMRSRAEIQHHTPIVVDEEGAAERKREIAMLRRQLAKVEASQVIGVLQDLIYALGLGLSQKEVAKRLNLSLLSVRATARLLNRRNVRPTEIVKDTHARWKAAYDAVRELGIQL